MKIFPGPAFLLHSPAAVQLYEEYASHLPIIDYHCHLPVSVIAANHQFANLTELWLAGDHYKWRAMRANGIPEACITGNKSDYEKFKAWAATVPYTVRNPLYHWTHLELQRYFGIYTLLSPETADEIWNKCNEQLADAAFSSRRLIQQMKVEYIATTDDPLDGLSFHRQLEHDAWPVTVAPAFRPDLAMNPDPALLLPYIRQLERISTVSITNFDMYLLALKSRHDFFHANGCSIADHGLEQLPDSIFTAVEINRVFNRLLSGQQLSPPDQDIFRSAMLYHIAVWNHERNWVQQYHLGALRNNNSRRLREAGPDTGWDSIGDFSQGKSLARFLDQMDNGNQLAKTVLYNLNPADNLLFSTMTANFNDGITPGKIQYGAAWWFLDEKKGIEDQLNGLSATGLLSRFIGMTTDSRSLMSYPRHEYFRRVLCNLIGGDIDRGELPADLPWLGQIVQNICYYNAKEYFKI